MRLLLSLALVLPSAAAQQPTVAPPDALSIMSRVAENQDRSEAERAHFVYVQHARVASRKGKTLHCEEVTDSRVTPAQSGSQQQILTLTGRLLVKGKYLTYTSLPADHKAGEETTTFNLDDHDPMDRDLVENMRHHLTDSNTRDGIGSGLFPLTSKAQAEYTFKLLGRESINGHDTWHIGFTPRDRNELAWKGDAYIDTVAYQPVVIHTSLSRKLPLAVRTLLGTNVPGLGFTVTYAPHGDVWFPSTFGTEFRVHVLFFLSREITLDAENRSFELTHVHSTIVGDGTVP